MEDFPLLTGCAFRKFDPGEKHITRTFRYNVLIFMFSGELCFTEDGKDIELTAGEYYIQEKNLFQEGRISSNVPEYFFIHFSGSHKTFKQDIPLRGRFKKENFYNYFENLTFYGTSEYKKQALFFEILDKLSAPVLLHKTGIEMKVKTYIDTHFSEFMDTGLLAGKFSYSKQHLEKLFKDSFGITIHRYITKKRIEEAKFLMLTSGRSLENIAYSCGYGDFSTFYRNFVAIEGISPLKWKKLAI